MRKNKQQLIEELHDGFDYNINDLKKMSKEELQELYDELHGLDVLFPNGRDYDSENEDGI